VELNNTYRSRGEVTKVYLCRKKLVIGKKGQAVIQAESADIVFPSLNPRMWGI
jgi:hypothetical protein